MPNQTTGKWNIIILFYFYTLSGTIDTETLNYYDIYVPSVYACTFVTVVVTGNVHFYYTNQLIMAENYERYVA